MFWIGLIVGGCLGFVACALCAINRISSLEERAERGPLCSMCETDAALQACRNDCKALEEENATLRNSKEQIVGHNKRLMNGFLYPAKGGRL